MKLHIVIPIINCLDLTKRAISSIQTKQSFTLHIMDQDSDQATKDWLDNQSLIHHRFAPRVPLSEAWNTGIQESLKDQECQYIFIPNNDVVFHKTTIDNLIDSIDKFELAMVTGENIAPKMSIQDMEAKDKWGNPDFDARPINSWVDEGPDFSCFMIKRDFTDKYGWFDENFKPAYCEDQDMHIRVRRMGGHAKRMTTAPYYHYASQTVSANPHIAGETGEGHTRNKAYYAKKWGTTHGEALKGNGHQTPFGDPTKDCKWWEGCEKYEV